MGKKYGNDYRVWVESAVAGTYYEIKGQTETERGGSSQPIDTTSKSDYPWSTSGPGSKGLTLNVGVVPDLPDANGYTRLETIAKATTPTTIKLQIRKGGAAGATPGDVVFECEMHITGFDDSYPMNGAVGTKFSFANAAAPTVMALA